MPLRAAFCVAWATPNSEASTPSTSAAPPLAALRAKAPVWVKQSSTRPPRARGWMASRLYFWSRKKPVFCPSATST